MTYASLKKQAKRWAPYWRDRLGLRDWHIEVAYIDDLDPLAQCLPNYPHRSAQLGLSANMKRWDGEDVEKTVVHELLHIHLGTLGVGLTKDGYNISKVNKTVLCEQVINALAGCLVDRRRGKP